MHRFRMRDGLRVFWVAMALTLGLPRLLVAQSDTGASAVTNESLAGTYDGGQMEVGAQLVLLPDGHFEYELAYGAMDEEAKGTWELRDGAVYLTTVPAMVPPRFAVVSDVAAPAGQLWVKMAKPVTEGARQRVYLLYGAKDEPDMVEIEDNGRVPLEGKRWPAAILLEIPVYPIEGKPILLTGAGGHRMVVRFEANDIGKADFRGMRLEIVDGQLVMTRRDLQLQLHFKHGKPE